MASASDPENVFDVIENKLKELKYFKLVKTYTDKFRERSKKSKEDLVSEARNWLQWARCDKNLSINEKTIPASVLQGSMIDVKVFTKYGPDDKIYDKHEDIRNRVARGNAFVKLDQNEGPICTVFALKKFTGGLGDDDDRDSGDDKVWKKYFIKPLEESSLVISTDKANGEAAHLSCLKVDGKFVICAGSKNVHLYFCQRSDIDQYTEDRYKVAKAVAYTIAGFLKTLDPLAKNLLLEFLTQARVTAIFEILNPETQHVEDLSYLKQPKLMFITWTFNDTLLDNDRKMRCIPPHVAIEIAKTLGLDTISYEEVPLEELDMKFRDVRNGYRYEGKVYYFLDSAGEVLGLLKKKTTWYVICRAIREKVRNSIRRMNKGDFEANVVNKKILTRINQIQNWLGFSDECREKWKVLGSGFFFWFVNGLKLGRFEFTDVADKFPVTWNKYLTEEDVNDQINLE